MRKQYPPQTSPYVVKVQGRHSTDNWQDFETARLQISVGQEYHEGEKLSSLITWCKHRFNKISICANDTLQRYNLMFEQNIGETEAQQVSSKLGSEWIARALPIVSGMNNVKIVRWDEWKALKGFQKGRLSTEWFYANNSDFRAAIDKNIEDIWARRTKANALPYSSQHYDQFFELSRAYLLEEITVFALMFDKQEAIDIYPGTTLFAATLFRGSNVEGAPVGLGKGHFCRIDFLKNKNFEL